MQVFISWSGDRGHAVATLFHEWLPDVLQAVRPWVSSSDIDKGAAWFGEISKALKESDFGVLIVTGDNLAAPWLLFEAGALANKMDKPNVCPLLVDVRIDQITGPLAALNLAEATQDTDMLKLIKSINKQLPEAARVSAETLERSFKRCWPEFREQLEKILAAAPAAELAERSNGDMLKELISLGRAQIDALQQLDRKMTRPRMDVTGLGTTELSARTRNALAHALMGKQESSGEKPPADDDTGDSQK